MSFTCQVGTYSNWVGSHYWSALNHRSNISDEDVVSLYNENSQGEFYPRTFLVDSPDSFGSIDMEEVDEPNDVEIHEFRQEPIHVPHPLRLALKKGLVPDLTLPWNFWTDLWELDKLPSSYVLPRKFVATENSNKFWFEVPEIHSDDIDEMPIRKLVEETDISINQIRLLADPTTSMTEHAVSLGDYLGNSCFAKSSSLILTGSEDQQSLCSQINLAYLIHTNSDNSKCKVIFFSSTSAPIRDSAIEAVWLDTCCSDPQLNEFNVFSPSLSIDDHSFFGNMENTVYMTNPHATHYVKNFGNPLPIRFDSKIIGGRKLMNSLFFKNLKSHVESFRKNFKGIYHQFSDRIEEEDFQEIIETLSSKIIKEEE